MEEISRLFNLFAYIAGGLVVLAIILTIIYFRWKASGQERGI